MSFIGVDSSKRTLSLNNVYSIFYTSWDIIAFAGNFYELLTTSSRSYKIVLGPHSAQIYNDSSVGSKGVGKNFTLKGLNSEKTIVPPPKIR